MIGVMMIDWHRLLPIYWLQNYPTSKKWDTVLNILMDTQPLVVVDEYTVMFGGGRKYGLVIIHMNMVVGTQYLTHW